MADRIADKAKHLGRLRIVSPVAQFATDPASAKWHFAPHRHDGFMAFPQRVPEQLIRWEAEYGWTRRGYGHPAYPSYAAEIGAKLPPRAHELLSERARFPLSPGRP